MNKGDVLTTETIAALATPIGRSAIGIIRMSGPQSFEILSGIFSPSPKTGNFERGIYHGWIMRDGVAIDEAVVFCFPGPNSYTGEDIVEISCHGNPVILDSVLNLLFKNGARLAERGEFTLRALLNNKMDLAQAESVLNIINASSEIEASFAVRDIKGHFSDTVRQWIDRIDRMLVSLEASVEFAEQIDSADSIEGEVSELLKETEEILDTASAVSSAVSSHTVLIVGRPNVGKSSLFNAVLNQDRSLVHHQQCTTRDMVCETIELSGRPIKLCDTAGILEGVSGVDKDAVERVFKEIKNGDIAILVVDGSDKIYGQEIELFGILREEIGSVIVFVNKQDIGKCEIDAGIFDGANIIYGSARAKTGIADLLMAVERFLPQIPLGRAYLLSSRQKALMEGVKSALSFAGDCYANQDVDVAIESLKRARSELARILGEKDIDIINNIFSNFCVGK